MAKKMTKKSKNPKILGISFLVEIDFEWINCIGGMIRRISKAQKQFDFLSILIQGFNLYLKHISKITYPTGGVG